jgi:hypothetical protein
MASSEIKSSQLAPLSSGDLLDRLVSLYREHFLALIKIGLLPTIISYTAIIAFTFGARNFALNRGDFRLATQVLLLLSGFGLFCFAKAISLFLIGGLAQELVNHYASGSPITAKGAYTSIRQNFWRLFFGAIVAVLLGILLIIALYLISTFTIVILMLVGIWILSIAPVWIQMTCLFVFGLFVLAAISIAIAMMWKRAAFIPQAIVVEKKSVSQALSRAFSLAGSEFKKQNFLPPVALIFFWGYITWSISWLFLIPLYIYGILNDIGLGMFSGEQPVWFAILSNTISQAADVVISPLLMLGFVLLYIDSRVRREGYDLELLANRYLPANEVIIPHGSFPMEVPKAKSQERKPPENSDDNFDSQSDLTVLSLR